MNFSKSAIPQIAQHYLNSPNHTLTLEEKNAFAEWVNHRYENAKALGIKEVRVSGQPYATAEELHSDFYSNRQILVSTDNNNAIVSDKQTNLKLRFFHDLQHALLLADFSWEGEVKVLQFCSMLTTGNQLLTNILRSEFIYQASAYFYLGEFPDTQKLVLTDFE